ncbi:hypothetical protein EZJ19_01560 [Parasulfuritortus cantonensis]|uniref:Cation transporter n=1 Tax=Parasulfuritortus cantonensis TaxID=2528202 RepID=A0A4R1BMZ9_9PROT|nr:Na+/H+ antiporter subunit E [Parasulfuritortus cantonensis]TCJ18920.1 hypothetical protein EZJ19_01560 [Parasulfuritortus cantonensis]
MTSNPAFRAAPARAYVIGFGTCLLAWILLTGTLAASELAAGALVALVATAAAGSRLTLLGGLRLSPAAPLHLVRYLGYFLVQLTLSNFDMARRILSPSLPLDPGMVEVHTGLRSELGRMLLANSITLTPGTLTVDVDDDRLLIHWIDRAGGTDMEAATRAIAAGFEQRIRGFLS